MYQFPNALEVAASELGIDECETVPVSTQKLIPS